MAEGYFHKKVIDDLCATEGWEKVGYAKRMRKELIDPWPNMGVRPDAWKIRTARAGNDMGYKPGLRVLHFAEIEDTSAIKDEKLERLVAIWWRLDTEPWGFQVHVFDRYGNQLRILGEQFFTDMFYKFYREHRLDCLW